MLDQDFPVHVFFERNPESIWDGQLFPSRIEQALKNAVVYVIVVGRDWTAEITRRVGQIDYVRLEVLRALEEVDSDPTGRKRVQIVLLEGNDWPKDVLALPAELRALFNARSVQKIERTARAAIRS